METVAADAVLGFAVDVDADAALLLVVLGVVVAEGLEVEFVPSFAVGRNKG